MHYNWCLRRIRTEGEYILPEDKTELTIGRGKNNDLKCLSLYVSRNHCKILTTNGLKMLDLASANGTFINYQRILTEREIPLKDGDVIGIGTPEATDEKCFVYKLMRIVTQDEEPRINCEGSTSKAELQIKCEGSTSKAELQIKCEASTSSVNSKTSIEECNRYKEKEAPSFLSCSCDDTVCENTARKRLREDCVSDVNIKVPRLEVQSVRNSSSEKQNFLPSVISQPSTNESSSTPHLDIFSKQALSSEQKSLSNLFLKPDTFQNTKETAIEEGIIISRHSNKGNQVSDPVESVSVNTIPNKNILFANCTAEPSHRKELCDRLQERTSSSLPGNTIIISDNKSDSNHPRCVDEHVNGPLAISSEHKVISSLKEDIDSEISVPTEVSAERVNLTSEEAIPNTTFNATIMNTEIKMEDESDHSPLDTNTSCNEETTHSARKFKENTTNHSNETPSTACLEVVANDVIVISDSEDELLEKRLRRVIQSKESNPESESINVDKSIKLNHFHSSEQVTKTDLYNPEQEDLENIDNAEQNLNKKHASFSSTAVDQEKANDMQVPNANSLQFSEDTKIFKAKPVVVLERIDAVISTPKIKQEENLCNYSMTEENIIELVDEDDEFPCSQMFEEAVVIKSEPMDDDAEEEEKIETKPFVRCPYDDDDDDDIICISDDSDESDNEWRAKLSQQDTDFADVAQSVKLPSKSRYFKEEQEEEEENIFDGEESLSCAQNKADDFEKSDALTNKHIQVKNKKTYGKPEIIEALPMPPRRAHQRGISANEAQRIYGEQFDQKCAKEAKEEIEHKSAKAQHKRDADKKKTKAESSREAERKHSSGEQSAELPKEKLPSKRKKRTNSASAHISGSDKKKIVDKRKELLKAISQKQAVLEKTDVANTSSVKSNAEVRIKITEKNRGAFLTETVTSNAAVKNATGKKKNSEAKEKCNSEKKKEIHIRIISSSVQSTSDNKEIQSKPSTSGIHSSRKQISQLPRIPRLSDKIGSTNYKLEDLVSKIEVKCSIEDKAERKEPMEIETKSSETGIVPKSSLKTCGTVSEKRKSVQFKEERELVQIFEIPKEQSHGLHPVGHVKDAPPPRRPYNQQQLISSLPVEEFIHTIVSWNIRWLEEQKNVPADQPPPVHENSLFPMLSSFISYSDYHRIVTPLLYLELWARISKDYEMSSSSKTHIVVGLDEATHLPPFPPRNKQLMMLRCHAAVSKEDMAKNNLPRYGDLVIFELGLESTNNTEDMEHCLSQGSGNCNYFSTIFAYVCKVSREAVTGTTHFHKELLSTSSRSASFKLNLTLLTRSRGYQVKLQKPMRMKVISYIRSDLRLFQALYYLPSSPLCKHIMDPTKQDFSLEELKRKTLTPIIKEDVLNESQKQAVLRITHACLVGEPKMCMIQGPPGTGKSHVIVNIIMQLLYGQNNYLMQRRKNKNFPRVLLCAPSNAAIDELVLRLLHIRQKIEKTGRFKMVRIGNMDTMNHKVREISSQELAKREVKSSLQMRSDIESVEMEINHCKAKLNSLEQAKIKNKIKIREIQMKLSQLQRNTPIMTDDKEMKRMERTAELKIINGADIVATTLGSCFNSTMESLFYPDRNGGIRQCAFSCCIIDEATQSQELETLIPLMLGVTALVLVGDAKQLPATVLSVKAKEFGLNKSLFARIQDSFEDSRSNPVQFLDMQYRMHPEICLWPNRFFYNAKLHTPSNLISQRSCPLVPYCILSLEYTQNSSSMPANRGEAQLIMELTLGILENLEKVKGRRFSMAIITPYNHQRTMILNFLSPELQGKIEVNTIDSFQGQERDIIIISVARTAGVGFLADSQRLNVALTRARCSLILCGNFSSLKNDYTWKMLLKNAEERKMLKHVPATISGSRDELMRLVVKQ